MVFAMLTEEISVTTVSRAFTSIFAIALSVTTVSRAFTSIFALSNTTISQAVSIS
jgi:hypothetical protein